MYFRMVNMESLNNLHYSDFLDIERSLSRILAGFQKKSSLVSNGVFLSPSEFAALSKFHYILSSELYG